MAGMGASKWVLGVIHDPRIEAFLPNLSATGYSIKSPQDGSYNCIAWAAGVDDNWWWPVSPYYWPPGISKDNTVQSFIDAFEQQRYTVCEDVEPETGYEKVVIYTKEGRPTHAARQLPSGSWTSKLGQSYDIEHQSLHGVEGFYYGMVAITLKRPIQSAESAQQDVTDETED